MRRRRSGSQLAIASCHSMRLSSVVPSTGAGRRSAWPRRMAGTSAARRNGRTRRTGSSSFGAACSNQSGTDVRRRRRAWRCGGRRRRTLGASRWSRSSAAVTMASTAAAPAWRRADPGATPRERNYQNDPPSHYGCGRPDARRPGGLRLRGRRCVRRATCSLEQVDTPSQERTAGRAVDRGRRGRRGRGRGDRWRRRGRGRRRRGRWSAASWCSSSAAPSSTSSPAARSWSSSPGRRTRRPAIPHHTSRSNSCQLPHMPGRPSAPCTLPGST